MADGNLPPSFEPVIARFGEWLEKDDLWGHHYGAWIVDFFQDFQEGLSRSWLDELRELPQAIFQQAFELTLHDFMSYEDEEDGYVVDAFLQEERAALTDVDVEFLLAMKSSRMSLYEISEVVPKSHLVLRDLLRKTEPIEVRERTASQYLFQWQTIAARVVTVRSVSVLTDSPLVVPTDVREEVALEYQEAFQTLLRERPKLLRKDARTVRSVQRETLQELAPYIAAEWLESQRKQAKRRPTLINDDQEEIVVSYASYPLTDPAGAIERLDAAEGFTRPDPSDLQWLWFDETPAEGRPIRAFLWLRNDRLDVETNSLPRRERLHERLTAIFGEGIGPALISEDSVENLMDRAPLEDERPFTEEEEAMVAELMKKQLDVHYRKTLDDQVPALGHRTPREWAATPEGRHEVAQWLKNLEATTAQADIPSMAQYDFRWMWKELGIEDLRR